MNTIEKIASGVGILIVVFTAGGAWTSLNNRIDKVDEKIAAIQKTLGSTDCNAILTRQMEAIERGRTQAREALEKLSDRYGCVRQANLDANAMTTDMMAKNVSMDVENAADTTTDLNAELNAVDVMLANKN